MTRMFVTQLGIVVSLLALIACTSNPKHETADRQAASAPDLIWNPTSFPNLFFNSKEIDDLKIRIQKGEQPISNQFKALRARSQKYQGPIPYDGRNIADLYHAIEINSTQAFALALLYNLTGNEEDAQRAKNILLAWTRSSIQSVPRFSDFTCLDPHRPNCPPEAYAIHLGKGLMHFAGAYDLLRANPSLLSSSESSQLMDFFRKGLVLVQEGARTWQGPGIPSCHWISNHTTAHTSAVMTLAALLGNKDLFLNAVQGSGAVPTNWKTLLEKSIYLAGDPAIGCEAPPRAPMLAPHSGEVVDRYRGFEKDFPSPLPSEPLKCQAGNIENRGLGYSLANLIHLSYGALVARHRGIDLFSETSPKGEHLVLPARYYAFYLMTYPDGTIITPSEYVGSKNYLKQCVRKGYLDYFELSADIFKGDATILKAFTRYPDNTRLDLDVVFFGKVASQNQVRFNFLNDAIFDLWKGTGDLSTLNVSRGSLNFLTTGPRPILTRDQLNFQARPQTKIRLSLRVINMNEARPLKATTFRLSWKSDKDLEFADAKQITSSVSVDREFRDYEIDLSANPNWKGLIRALQVNPASDSELSVSIRSIEIVSAGL